MSGLKDKVVLVTGSSDGIGACCAVEFAEHGSKVFLTGRNIDNLRKVVKKCEAVGVEVGYLAIDLNGDEAPRILADAVINKFGTVHILVNNAGAAHKSDQPLLAGTGAQAFDLQYKLQVRVPWLLSGYLVKQLCHNKGSIINMSSALGKITYSAPGYCSLKAAPDHMTRCLAVELGPYNVRVNTVAPGPISTDMAVKGGIGAKLTPEVIGKHLRQTIPLVRAVPVGKPEELAKAVVFLASDDAAYITGAYLAIDGGYVLSHPGHVNVFSKM